MTYSFFSYNRFCSLNRSNNRPPPSAPPIARLRRRNLGERWCHLPRFGICDELHLTSLSLWLQRIECGALDTLVPDHRALSIVTHRHFWILPIQRLIPLLSQYKCKRRVATLFPGAMGMICLGRFALLRRQNTDSIFSFSCRNLVAENEREAHRKYPLVIDTYLVQLCFADPHQSQCRECLCIEFFSFFVLRC